MRMQACAVLRTLSIVGLLLSAAQPGRAADPGPFDTLTLATPDSPSAGLPAAPRAIWVTRFHYRTPEDIAAVMRNCRSIGVDTILWQVRGEATVAYPSDLEPWAVEYEHVNPGYDPLAIAVDEAHRCGMKIHAWCNVMPGWRGKKPAPRGHLLNTRPEWFLFDGAGKRQPLGDAYVILNPCLPEVRDHIVRVFEEIVTRYRVDGLHLDYVRYAWEETRDAQNRYPRDPWTVAEYRRQTGLSPDENRERWHHWRAAQLTQLVADTRAMLARARPGAPLTAAVWASPHNGYREYMQNAVAWLNVGLLDAVFPMAYTEDATKFRQYINTYRELSPAGRIIPGVGLYKHDDGSPAAAQLRDCLTWGDGAALYSYDSLFGWSGEKLTAKEQAKANRQRAERLAAWQEIFGRR